MLEPASTRMQPQINTIALKYKNLQQWEADGWRIAKACIIMQTLCFVFFLVVGCRDYLPVAFCTCEQNVAHFFCAYAIRQTPCPWCTQYRCIGPGYVAFSCVPHAFPHTNSGISTAAVMSVVYELISVQAAPNHSNRGRPKNKIRDPHHHPKKKQTKSGGKKTPYVCIALQLTSL